MASLVTTIVRGLKTCAPRACYAGAVREAGGVLAQREKAQEDQYFYNLQKYQLKRLRDDCDKKIKYHRDQIDKHTEAIRREEQKFK
ncbi:ATPase inhibitor mai-2, mitochondrial-like [Homalodisca vitripennis]|uniref:ATPase inhibitor mai-2, mitochondrial-like n=1 Tax=Homalodisca vitripennis TaxID=197043 RepID=UPI001EE9F452|nr:ATPase inhibitor mai-2, mitochondrial-like [Homalodisca vitripennis]